MKNLSRKFGFSVGLLLLAGGTSYFFINRTGRPGNTQTSNKPRFQPPAFVGLPSSSSPVVAAVGIGKQEPYEALLQQCDALGTNLTDPELMWICRALDDGLSHLGYLLPWQRHHLANQLMNRLINQEYRPAWLTEQFWRVAYSSSADETIRDYAVQHLAQIGEKSARDLAQVVPLLQEFNGLLGSRSAGTAILGLEALSRQAERQKYKFDSSIVPRTVNAVLDAPAPHPATLAVALQLSTKHSIAKALGISRKILQDPRSTMEIKMASVACLSAMGDPTIDGPLLQKLPLPEDHILASACQIALSRLNTK